MQKKFSDFCGIFFSWLFHPLNYIREQPRLTASKQKICKDHQKNSQDSIFLVPHRFLFHFLQKLAFLWREASIMLLVTTAVSGITLLFEHSRRRASEIEDFEIFSRLRENQLPQQFFIKFNLLLLFLIS